MYQSWLARLLKRKQISSRTQRVAKVGTLLVWLGYLAFVVWIGWDDRNTIIRYLVQADYLRLLSAIGSYVASLGAVLIGWAAIMRAFVEPLSWWTHVQIYCITLAARRLPGTLWYIGGRLVLYNRLGIPWALVSLASGIELVVSVVAGGLVGLVLLPFGLALSAQAVALLAGGVLAGSLILHPSGLRVLVRLSGNPSVDTIRIRYICIWLLAYSAAWVMGGVMLGQIIGAFQSLGSGEMCLVIGAWALAGAAGLLTCFLPSSFGVTELTLVALLSQVMPVSLVVMIVILTRILTILFEVIISAVFALLKSSVDVGV